MKSEIITSTDKDEDVQYPALFVFSRNTVSVLSGSAVIVKKPTDKEGIVIYHDNPVYIGETIYDDFVGSHVWKPLRGEVTLKNQFN